MTFPVSRRLLLGSTIASAAAAGAGVFGSAPQKTLAKEEPAIQPLHLGLMTYNLARDWDLDTVIKNCKETGFEHMELRTTHAHGVEVSLSKSQRGEVRRRVADSGLKLSLASGFAYHWDDPAKLRENIEGTQEYLLLAQDVGALGIRVFPNALLQGVSEEKTIDQIAKAVAQLGSFAADHGVELRLENHGQGTNRVSVVKRILDAANSPHVYMIWNCDGSDVEDPGFEANFDSVKDRIRHVHLHELSDLVYPYRKLFRLLRQNGYQGSCHAEVDASEEPIRFMHYYRALFLALQDVI